MKKPHFVILLSLLFVLTSVFVIWFSVTESTRQQDLRGQAYETNQCADAPVNTQFRKWEQGTDKPWYDGTTIEGYNLLVSDSQPAYIDVNCFAKNGAALLQNPKIEIKRTYQNVIEIIPLQNPNVHELRKFALTKPGKYTFTCVNTAGTCSDTDGFTLAGAAVTPSTSPTPTPSVTPTTSPTASPVSCGSGQYAASDVNKDCITNIQDYAVFLQDYRQQTGL